MSATSKWSATNVPDLSGRVVVVTGGNSGIGFEAARAFARAGATLILACRDPAKAEGALRAIRHERPGATVDTMALDLAHLESIRAFARAFGERHLALDVLCNNAGVMALPYMRTTDGFEMQFGTNHLGHFALTGLLLDRILAAPAARVVTVSSTAHRIGQMRFDDLQGESRYGRWSAYGQSKLANLLFAYELQRRLEATGAAAISVACHPGYSATNLQFAALKLEGSAWMERVSAIANRLFAQDAAMGALPTLYAATAAGIRGGDYVGPDGFAETWGHPKRVQSNARSHDLEAAARLWRVSQELTGVRYLDQPS